MLTTALDYKTAAICIANQPFKWNLIYLFNSDPDQEECHYYNKIKKDTNQNSVYYFDDVDCPLFPYVSPSKLDIKSIIKFAMGKNNIMIACPNGMTRSVSIAYIIRCIEEDPKIAIQSMTKKICHPNELIIRLGAELLENEEVYKAYKDIYSTDEV